MLEVASVRSILRGRVGVGIVRDIPTGRTPRDVDFAMGRAAAAAALADLGAPDAEIPVGPDRAPVWPSDIVGSIAHTRGVAVAAVAWATAFRSLGIDVEPAERRIDAGTMRRIRRPEEEPNFGDRESVLALFCAKEATYKALAPLGADKLGFHDVEFHPAESGELEGRIVVDGVSETVPHKFAARYLAVSGFLVAVVQIAEAG